MKGTKVTVVEHMETKTFVVAGCTLPDVWQSLMRNGPNIPGHENAVGSTDATLGAHWELEARISSCFVKSATVELKLVVQLPELGNKDAMAPSLAASLQEFVADVAIHEEGHVAISRASAKELQRAIETQLSTRTCDALERALRSRVAEVQAAHSRKHATYDQQAIVKRDVVFPTAP